ncbi:thymidylate kinase 1 [Candidatus Moduliflexus flocculans]|uniref:Thymidylate kinase n=1 Tax=Candidatus Moduliflexus flocculans TaxID=1499966 RepID=A0A0S6W198_9BACT|nr:thymidylate kinase 1 [Candidatus Moduliflexus flocculans]
MKQTAKFITFEGIEGCGKTTQAKLLIDALHQRSVSAILTREPGGTRIGDQIRKILLHSENTDMTPMAELLLYEASRAQHVRELILPNLQNGINVLCDRYGDASIAYQGAGRNIAPDIVKEANALATGGLQPDLTLLIDVTPEQGLARARARNLTFNFAVEEGRFEEEDIRFHRAVREGYLALAQSEPARFCLIDGSGDVEEVQRRIQAVVLPLFENAEQKGS